MSPPTAEVVIFCVWIVVIYYFVPHTSKSSWRHALSIAGRGKGGVCLTFDDGPDPRATPQILEILERHSAKATFFFLGEQIERHPDLAQAVVAAGHTIGEHSYKHTHAWKTGPFRTWRDLERGGQAIAKVLAGAESTYLRPPYGKMNMMTLFYLRRRAKKPVFWDIDPRDYAAGSAQEIAERAIAGFDRGSVLLLHDGRRDPAKSPAITAEALELILAEIDRRGLKVIPLGEIFGSLPAEFLTGLH